MERKGPFPQLKMPINTSCKLDDINVKLSSLQRPETVSNRSLNIAIRDLPESDGENINNKVNAVIKDGLHMRNVSVKSAVRKASINQTKPDVVIASFKTSRGQNKDNEGKVEFEEQ